MYQITAIYAHPESPEAFVEHYRTTHAPLVRELKVRGCPLAERFQNNIAKTPW